METRGVKSKQLIEILKVAGMYEEGMEVEEMRQMAQAIEMSAISYDSAECFNVERALLVSKQILKPLTIIDDNPSTFPGKRDRIPDTGQLYNDCSASNVTASSRSVRWQPQLHARL